MEFPELTINCFAANEWEVFGDFFLIVIWFSAKVVHFPSLIGGQINETYDRISLNYEYSLMK